MRIMKMNKGLQPRDIEIVSRKAEMLRNLIFL
jgi:hypothetical protein